MGSARHKTSDVAWLGLVVKLNGGQTHAVELDPQLAKIFCDLIVTQRPGQKLEIQVSITGQGRYWQEGATMGPDVQPRRQIAGGVYGNAIESKMIEGGVRDGT